MLIKLKDMSDLKNINILLTFGLRQRAAVESSDLLRRRGVAARARRLHARLQRVRYLEPALLQLLDQFFSFGHARRNERVPVDFAPRLTFSRYAVQLLHRQQIRGASDPNVQRSGVDNDDPAGRELLEMLRTGVVGRHTHWC